MSASGNNNKPPPSGSRFDERQWVLQIRQTLDEELEEETEIPVCIFSVPKNLMACDPGCYTPQQVPIGPYHYFRPEMYEMERYKLAAARKLQQSCLGDNNLKFADVVHQLRAHEPRIRACYHKYLTVNGETLAWMMAVDSCFMLEFLSIYVLNAEGKQLTRISSRMSHLVDITGRKSTHNAILRDMMMLENQIPLFILRKMMEARYSSLEIGDSMLYAMLMGLFKVLAPFKTTEELPESKAMDCYHLLDMFYRLMVRKVEKKPLEISQDKEHQPNKNHESGEPSQPTAGKEAAAEGKHNWASKYAKKFLEEVWKIVKKLLGGPLSLIKKILFSKAVVFITKLPWQIISNIPGLKVFLGPIQTLFSLHDDGDGEDEDGDDDGEPPRVEEIAIPSVSELTKAYVKFQAVEAGILSIKFDSKARTLYLPVIRLDENSEVIMRNLVAYEAGHASGPVIFSRYTELMNGIIDTEEDVQILRDNGIILNRLKSDEDVKRLWNGMHKSARLTKAPKLDRVIEEVNKYHSQRWKVKLRHMMRAYVFGSWQVLTLLACIALLLLMTLQSFCTVYNCRRFFPIEITEQPPVE